jgi:hypothetical protein
MCSCSLPDNFLSSLPGPRQGRGSQAGGEPATAGGRGHRQSHLASETEAGQPVRLGSSLHLAAFGL